jgi:hypothetical protein
MTNVNYKLLSERLKDKEKLAKLEDVKRRIEVSFQQSDT